MHNLRLLCSIATLGTSIFLSTFPSAFGNTSVDAVDQNGETALQPGYTEKLHPGLKTEIRAA